MLRVAIHIVHFGANHRCDALPKISLVMRHQKAFAMRDNF
jgi:hypothetical protein